MSVWMREALARAETAPSTFVRAVASDADGTLWEGDVADTLFLQVTSSHALVGEGLARFQEGAQALLGDAYTGDLGEDGRRVLAGYGAGSIDIEALCDLQTVALGDRSLASLDALLDRAAEEVSARFHPDVRAFLEATEARGWPLRVVSGSLGRLVEKTLARAGVAYASVRGGTLRMRGDHVEAALAEPIPLHGRKVAALDAMGAWPAVIGMGDGGWDSTFLKGVAVPVLVRPKAALRAAMAGHPGLLEVD